jgi:voltage-gated potassium channel
MSPHVRRLLVAVVALVLLVSLGTGGYFVLGGGRWGLFECMYMTCVSISTVGSSELSGLADVAGGHALTLVLIASGVGVLAYVQANLTALLVEGVIGQAWRRNRMNNKLSALKNHVVVAGGGSTGAHVIEELLVTETVFVLIERSQEIIDRINADLCQGKLLYVLGDATDDHALAQANVATAKGVIAALTHDKDNLFVTLSARSLNPTARIVTKVVDDTSMAKMLRAGATAAVSPTQIGGRRMASEIVRPEVTEFMDQMLRDKERNLRLEEVVVGPGSSLAGKALKDSPIRRETRVLVVAVRPQKDEQYTYNPEPDYILLPGMTLVVMGDSAHVTKLRALAAATL